MAGAALYPGHFNTNEGGSVYMKGIEQDMRRNHHGHLISLLLWSSDQWRSVDGSKHPSPDRGWLKGPLFFLYRGMGPQSLSPCVLGRKEGPDTRRSTRQRKVSTSAYNIEELLAY